MKPRPIETVILMDRAGEQIAFRFHKCTERAGKLELDLKRDNVFFRFCVFQKENGMTELLRRDARYRVSGVSYRVESASVSPPMHTYALADSYDCALNLLQFMHASAVKDILASSIVE